MNTNQEIVRKADALLRQNRLFQDGKVQHLWEQVEWTESGSAGGDAQFVTGVATPTIALYPKLAETQEPEASVLREFGLLIQSKGGPRAQTIWDDKLDLPTPDDINAAVAVLSTRLADAEPGERKGEYKELLSRYPDTGSAVPRLVFVNIANALIANNIPYRDSNGVDIRTWGPTAEYCAFKRYHSLVPLTSAYCPAEVHRCFGTAFARFVIDELACCAESSTKAGLRRIVLNVVSRLHPLPPLPRH